MKIETRSKIVGLIHNSKSELLENVIDAIITLVIFLDESTFDTRDLHKLYVMILTIKNIRNK